MRLALKRGFTLAVFLILISLFGLSSHQVQAQKPSDHTAIALQITEAEKLSQNKEYDKSNAAYQKAIGLLTQIGESCSKAQLQIKIVNNQLQNNQNAEALSSIDLALSSFLQSNCPDTSMLIELYINRYSVLSDLNEYGKAREPIETAYKVASVSNDKSNAQLPRIFRLLAGLNADMGANFQALGYAEKGMEIRRSLYTPDQTDYISGWYDIANFAERTGDYEKAYLFLDSIISSPIAHQYSYLPQSYHLLSLVCIRRNEYDIAKKYASLALIAYDQKYGENHYFSSFPLQELGSAQMGLLEFKEALKSYEQAYKFRLKRYGPDHRLSLSSLSSMIKAKMALGDTLSSIESYKKVVESFTTNYSVDQAEKYVLNTLKVGELYEGAGLMDSAITYYKKGYNLADKYYKPGDRVHAQANSLLAAVGAQEQREAFVKGAKFHLTKDSSLFSLSRSQMAFATDKYAILSLYHIHAKNLFARYEKTKDQRHLLVLVSLEEQFDLIKDEIFRQLLSIKSIIKAAPLIREISLLRLRSNHILFLEKQDQNYLNAMLQSMEESKNLALQSHLYEKNLKHVLGLSDSLLQLESDLYMEINRLNLKLETSPSDSLEKINLDLERRYFDLRRNILLQSEKYNRIVQKVKPSISSVQKTLSSDQMILNYFLDDDELYIIYVTKHKAGVAQKKMDAADTQRLEDYIRFASRLPKEGEDLLWQDGHYFFTKLIPENIPSQINELIIIPDNQLNVVPFDILLSSPPKDPVKLQSLDYLIRRYEISYLSGLNHKILSESKRMNNEVLAFAPFDQAIDSRMNNLPVLKFSGEEIESIGSLYKIDQYRGVKATEQMFKMLSADFNILHIASHALINGASPMRSNILFYPADSMDDGKLELWELYAMNIPAQLAVLSACRTSDGELIKGAGLMNIARGFYTAGTHFVLSNLWPVQDFAASQFMRPFYNEYKDSKDAPRALRNAKLDYLNSQSGPLAHPMYWAGWMLQSSEMHGATGGSSMRFILIGGVLLVLLVIWFLRRKKSEI